MKSTVFIVMVMIAAGLLSCTVTPPGDGGGGGDNPPGKSWQRFTSEYVSTGGGAYVQIRLSNDTPYVAFQDYNNGSAVVVRRYTGTIWASPSVVSSGSASYISMEISDGGIPYVLYGSGFPLLLSTKNQPGPVWTTVGTTNAFGHEAWYPALALNASGVPYVSYQDRSDTNHYISVMYYHTGDNQWTNLGPLGTSLDTGGFNDIAISPASTPYVAYQNLDQGEFCTVMYYSSSWQYFGGTTMSTGPVKYVDLDFLGTTPIVSYQQSDSSIHTRWYSNAAWRTLGSPLITGSDVGYLEMNTEIVPLLVFPDPDHTNSASVYVYTNGVWQPLGLPGFNNAPVLHTSIDVDSQGRVFVAFLDSDTNRIDVWVYE